MEKTLEQQEQLKKWSSERDAVVADLFLKKNENERLIAENQALTQANKDLAEREFQFKKALQEGQMLLSEIPKNRIENAKLLAIKNELNEAILSSQEASQIKNWTIQRDALNTEIVNLRTEKEKLEKANRALSISNTNIDEKIRHSLGRMEEISKKEEEFVQFTTKDSVARLAVKSNLENEILNYQKQIDILQPKKDFLMKDIAFLSDAHEKLFTKVGVLDKVVDHVTKVSSQNSYEIDSLVSKLKSSLKELTDINQDNVTKTNQVLEKLPKMLLELQRTHLIRNKI